MKKNKLKIGDYVCFNYKGFIRFGEMIAIGKLFCIIEWRNYRKRTEISLPSKSYARKFKWNVYNCNETKE